MTEKYYLALFNEDTWGEFLENGSSVYGTTFSKYKRMETINIDDFLICYVTKRSRFVGLLKIISKAYFNKQRIWKNATYPVRVDVCPIYILKTENGIPILNIKEELEIFNSLKHRDGWTSLFRNSLNLFRESDAKIIIEKLKEASNK